MLENMENWGFVRLLARWFSSEGMSRRIGKFMQMVNEDTLRQTATRLIIWAVVIIVVATIIDWVFYLMRPEQRLSMLRTRSWIISLIEKVKNKRQGGQPPRSRV